jgi:uncharacterized membrane protein (UPF0182 family)
MEETLDAALARLFGGQAGAPAPSTAPAGEATREAAPPDTARGVEAPSAAAAALLRQLRDYFDRATAAQRAGDWAEYGAQMRRLGELLHEEGGAAAATPPRQE